MEDPMGDGIYLAGASMIAQEVRQEALVHNLANASTPGYKATRVFAKELKDVEANVGAMREAERDQTAYIDFSQGPIRETGRDLDFALDGEGFFVVLTPEGERFTRNGSFSLDVEGQLVSSSGFPVLTDVGPVLIDDGTAAYRVDVNGEGEIFLDDRFMGKLDIRNFESTRDLQKEGNGLFSPKPGRRPVEAEPTASIRQRYLEESNVYALDEMVRMMGQFRDYEASYKMVQIQDGALRRAINDLIPR
jgi:flagellar basal-body rod protein FlgG